VDSGSYTGADHTADGCPRVDVPLPSPLCLGSATRPKPASCTAQDGSCELHKRRPPLRFVAGGSLADRKPDVARLLDAERSGFSAAQIAYGSKVLAVWRCEKGGHTWCAAPNTLTNATHPARCGICTGKVVIPSTSLAVVAPLLAEEWDVEANSGLTASQVAPNSNRRYWWMCPVAPDHRWKASPNNRYGRGSKCPMCSGQKASSTNNLTLSRDLSLLREWDVERNAPVTPGGVTRNSHRRVWWACPEAEDHRWEASVGHRTAGRGCPCCAGHQLSSTNRLSTLRPDVARELDETRSKIAAHDLSVSSNKRVWWNCLADTDPKHEPWQATVLNRTHGKKGKGTSCPGCQLVGTSAQELRLKAELSIVLPIDPDLDRVPGRPEKVDMLAVDEVRDLRLVLEFDGAWWHNKEESPKNDAAKACRLRDAGWTVVRIREAPLDKLDPRFDVVVAFQADPDAAAVVVLCHLADLGIITRVEAAAYQPVDGPLASDLANQWIRARLGEKALDVERRSHQEAWSRMCAALAWSIHLAGGVWGVGDAKSALALG
jgi:hypothetical protein